MISFTQDTLVEHNGRQQTVREWRKENGLSVQRVWKRVNSMGWTLEDAVTTPPRKTGSTRFKGNARLIEFNGKILSLAEWGRELGMSYVCVSKRLKRYPVEIALSRPKCDGLFVTVDGRPQTPPSNKPNFGKEELKNGVSLKLANQRLRQGWTREEAATTPTERKHGSNRWGHSRGNLNRLKDLAALGIII